MKSLVFIFATAGLLGAFTAPVFAQHTDIEFRYADGKIAITPPPAGLMHVFTGTFPTSGLLARVTDNPGFASEVDQGLGIGAFDLIGYNVLDNLYYWNGSTFVSPGSSSITIKNGTGADTVITGSSGFLPVSFSAPVANIIGQATASGDFHSHPRFTLSSGAPFGGYGLVLNLASDEPGIANSKSFGVFFNYGLPAAQFNAGATAFDDLLSSSAVPEPGSYALMMLAVGGGLAMNWRRVGKSLRGRRRVPRFTEAAAEPCQQEALADGARASVST